MSNIRLWVRTTKIPNQKDENAPFIQKSLPVTFFGGPLATCPQARATRARLSATSPASLKANALRAFRSNPWPAINKPYSEANGPKTSEHYPGEGSPNRNTEVLKSGFFVLACGTQNAVFFFFWVFPASRTQKLASSKKIRPSVSGVQAATVNWH